MDMFEKEKIAYKNIEIPEELEFIVIKSIKEGNKKNNRIGLIGKIVAASFITIFIALNLFPRFSTVAQNLPIIGKLAELLTIDKGFENAVEEDLVQDIGYEEEINGIKLKVGNVVGDYKAMWIEYELLEDARVSIELKDINESKEIEAFSSHSTKAFGKEGNYIQINFKKFEEEFLLIFNIYDKDKTEELAIFKVPVKLKEKFNTSLKDITINNNIIKTEIGDIEIKNIATSNTRTIMSFILNSNEYNFVRFDNPVLIDSYGNEYNISSSYSIFDSSGINNIEFQGELKEGSIIFKADGIFYDKKYDKKIIVDLTNRLVKDNEFNTSFESYENNILQLKTENVEGIEFKNEDKRYILTGQYAHLEEFSDGSSKVIEIITNLEIFEEDDGFIELEIEAIAKDKTSGFEAEIKD